MNRLHFRYFILNLSCAEGMKNARHRTDYKPYLFCFASSKRVLEIHLDIARYKGGGPTGNTISKGGLTTGIYKLLVTYQEGVGLTVN